MLPTLLYVNHIPIPTHHTQRLDLVQLRCQMHRCLFLFIQHAGINWTVVMMKNDKNKNIGEEQLSKYQHLHGEQIVQRFVGIALDGNVKWCIARIVLGIEVCKAINEYGMIDPGPSTHPHSDRKCSAIC